MSIVKIGQTAGGGFEFGESYHVAAYLAANKKHSAVVIGANDAAGRITKLAAFLKSVSPNVRVLATDKNIIADGPGNTANYFEQEANANISDRVSEELKSKLLNHQAKAEVEKYGDKFLMSRKLRDDLKACFLWIRHGSHEPFRNMASVGFSQLSEVLGELGYEVILVGDTTSFTPKNENQNLIRFYDNPLFQADPHTQILLLNHLCEKADIRFSIGMKSGAMDGLAFLRKLKTIYFSAPDHNARMNKVGKAFPTFVLAPIRYTQKFTAFQNSELEFAYATIDPDTVLT